MATHVATDGTYKLNWNDFPVTMIGTTDLHKHYHPFGIGLSINETAEDYQFMFTSLSECVQLVHCRVFKPSILLADAAQAITNGFVAAYGSVMFRIVCWAHVLRNVDAKLDAVEKSHRDAVLGDVVTIQLAGSPAIFERT